MISFGGGTAKIGNDWRGRDRSTDGLSERPAHSVEVAPFELDATEVPVWAYRICVDDGGCEPPAKQAGCTWAAGEGGDQLPVNCVTYDQAAAFCGWADKRLPSEVEWETAAGGIDPKRMFPWGPDFPSSDRANLCGAECRLAVPSHRSLRQGEICWKGECRKPMIDFDDGQPTVAPVGSYPAGATPEGLHDMAGNLWEWTSSPVCGYPKHDCAETPERIIRGGGWTHRYLLSAEVTTRDRLARNQVSDGVGFRCAR
jgi:formylglycine-generating enzyme required for sulfatase activity